MDARRHRGEPLSQEPVILRNTSRVIIPASIGVLVLVMFVPPLVLHALESSAPAKSIMGAVAVLLVAIYYGYSAVRAPMEARFDDGIRIRRLVKESHYELSQVRKWFFAVPSGSPTQSSPRSNALLQLWMQDGTHFRAEVTAEEAACLAATLPHVAITNTNATP